MRGAGPEPAFGIGLCQHAGIERRIVAAVICQTLQFLDIGQPPLIGTGQCQVFAIRQGFFPISGLSVIGLLPDYVCGVVGDSAISIDFEFRLPVFIAAHTTIEQFCSLCRGLLDVPIEEVEKDSDRDVYMDAEKAVEYGLVDEVLAVPEKE